VPPEGRWRAFTYDELLQPDKANLATYWLPDESLEDSWNLPEPDEIAAEIVDDVGPLTHAAMMTVHADSMSRTENLAFRLILGA
jgi:hypothetical protein